MQNLCCFVIKSVWLYRTFVAKSVLSKNFLGGEKMTNMRYGFSLRVPDETLMTKVSLADIQINCCTGHSITLLHFVKSLYIYKSAAMLKDILHKITLRDGQNVKTK